MLLEVLEKAAKVYMFFANAAALSHVSLGVAR